MNYARYAVYYIKRVASQSGGLRLIVKTTSLAFCATWKATRYSMRRKPHTGNWNWLFSHIEHHIRVTAGRSRGLTSVSVGSSPCSYSFTSATSLYCNDECQYKPFIWYVTLHSLRESRRNNRSQSLFDMVFRADSRDIQYPPVVIDIIAWLHLLIKYCETQEL